MTDYTYERGIAIQIAAEAGSEIRRLYDARLAETYIKADDSPVTDADLASDRIIRGRLAEYFPDDGILTEEGIDDPARLAARRCWVVDPIDGTQQFVNRTGQFDVLVALVIEGRPVVGVMLQPATGFYMAAALGAGAIAGTVDSDETEPLLLAQPDHESRVVTTIWFGAPESLPYLDIFARRMEIAAPQTMETGVLIRGHLDPGMATIAAHANGTSISAFDQPAHGLIGVPMRGDGTMAWEWDYAAADMVVNEAGGRFTDWTGGFFQYNKADPRNMGGLVIGNTVGFHERMLEAIAPDVEAIGQLTRE